MEFRKATISDFQEIWEIIKFAKESRKKDGSKQWQDGYPNGQTIKLDIEKEFGYVFFENNEVVFYVALIFGVEPTYQQIEGKWLSENQDYCVMHRMAVAQKEKGKGLVNLLFQEVDEICRGHQIFNIKVDTNFDNVITLHLLNKLGFTYCGEITVRGEPRKAFEKIIK